MLIQLVAKSLRIVLVPDGRGRDWVFVILSWDGSAIILGAERRQWVLTRLRLGLDPVPGQAALGEIDGMALTGVLTLAEHHGRIYSALRGDCVVWFFQDAEGHDIGSIELDSSEREHWKEILDANL